MASVCCGLDHGDGIIQESNVGHGHVEELSTINLRLPNHSMSSPRGVEGWAGVVGGFTRVLTHCTVNVHIPASYLYPDVSSQLEVLPRRIRTRRRRANSLLQL